MSGVLSKMSGAQCERKHQGGVFYSLAGGRWNLLCSSSKAEIRRTVGNLLGKGRHRLRTSKKEKV